jgi:hypothetical protein
MLLHGKCEKSEKRLCFIFGAMILVAQFSTAQTATTADPVKQDPTQANSSSVQEQPKRILGFIPNYRTDTFPDPFIPLTTKEKFATATRDSFDPGAFLFVGIIAGFSQAANSNPTFGQGAAGYGRRYGTAYADNVIGNYMTEAIYPTLLHQDPRYFVRGKGRGLSRLGYAIGQIFVSHDDEGHPVVNYSELVGNATAVAIGTAYYPDGRNATDAATRWGTQIGLDMAGNILKEFWPDIRRKVFHKD